MSSNIVVIDTNIAKNNSIIQEKNSLDYKVLNYEKGYVCFDDEDTGNYRSVVVSNVSNRVVAYGPRKSITYDNFVKKYPDSEGNIPNGVYVSEMVEGTMINLFFDKERNVWEIATKGAVGGHYWYFRKYYGNNSENSNTEYNENNQYTFRQMFMEAIGEHVLNDINDSFLTKYLSKDLCYSFVLQHPANHIVLNITCPIAYLVAIYEISLSNDFIDYDCIKQISLYEYANESMNMMRLMSSGIFHLPRVYNTGWSNTISYNELINGKEFGPFPMGYMLVHSLTGDRLKINMDSYERLKELRGNHPNLQYQYLSIMRTGKLNEFLHYFPIYNKLFYQFHEQITEYVKSVHKLYLEIFVKKNKAILDNLHKSMKYHLQQIHYNKHICEKQIVTRHVVMEWFLHSLEPGQFMYMLRG
jgi:hypothetical protein